MNYQQWRFSRRHEFPLEISIYMYRFILHDTLNDTSMTLHTLFHISYGSFIDIMLHYIHDTFCNCRHTITINYKYSSPLLYVQHRQWSFKESLMVCYMLHKFTNTSVVTSLENNAFFYVCVLCTGCPNKNLTQIAPPFLGLLKTLCKLCLHICKAKHS